MNSCTDFKKISLDERELFDKYFSKCPSQQIIYSFDLLYIWKDVEHVEFATTPKSLIIRGLEPEKGYYYFFPFGCGDIELAMPLIEADARSRGEKVRLLSVNAKQAARLAEEFTGRFDITTNRDNSEYLYTTETFMYYRGSALQAKRNYVNFAKKNFTWGFEPISRANIDDCFELAHRAYGEGNDSFELDQKLLKVSLDNYERLNLQGGAIRIDGRIEAMIICSPLSDGKTLAGLYLRANHDLKGVAPLLLQEYFLHYTDFKFFNFDQDMGIEGLRKNKLSFQPCELIDLYQAIEI